MMQAKSVLVRAAATAAGGMILVGIGTAAMAEFPDADSSSDVDVSVDIEDAGPQGALSLTVAANETTLVEDGSTDSYRQFTGALPEVTVTDTRTEAPEGAMWYVMGQASDFEGDSGQEAISPDHLGWTPRLLTEGEGDGSEVAPGDDVGTVLDDDGDENNVGLVDQELLAMTLDSAEAQAASGQWTSTADLVLKTDVDVEPGSYSSLLTLSLFEDTF